MRTLIPIALLVGAIAAGSSVHSATEGSTTPAGSLSGKTYLGTFEPAAKQPPTASGPSAYDDGKAASGQPARKPDAPAPAPASAEASAAQAPAVEQPATDPKRDTGDAGTTAKTTPEPAAAQGVEKSFDVKNNFRNICSFCHADYGRKAGRGPQLMDSPRSDEFLFDRIKHGLTGRMPGFGGTYSDAQINQFVKFIRSLKPGEEPKNPA
jgi:mono/diheme cytochrome c family protein